MYQRLRFSIPATLLTLLLVVMLLAPVTRGQGLVTRDDFRLHDTTVQPQTFARWPWATLDGAGRIFQTNVCTADMADRALTRLGQYNCYSSQGYQTQPVINYLPATMSLLGSPVDVGIWSRPQLCTDEKGFTAISTVIQPVDDFQQYGAIFLFDEAGTFIRGRCIQCDIPGQSGYIPGIPHLALNNAGLVGVTWEAVRDLVDSLFVCLYDAKSDTFGPIRSINFSLDPSDIDVTLQRQPQIKVADNGDYVVCWVPSVRPHYPLVYSIYHTDGSTRRPVSIANCVVVDSDTFCVNNAVQDFRMAMESDGDFYLVWTGDQPSLYCDVRFHVWVRGFHADGTPKYDPVRVNDTDSLWLWADAAGPMVACDDFGNVLVAWGDARNFPACTNDPPRDLFAQKVGPAGELVGVNYRINNVDGAVYNETNFSCDINNYGQALFAWTNRAPINPSIAGQLMPYDSIGHFKPGDINCDMTTSISDLTRFVAHLFQNQPLNPWPRNLSDFNSDGMLGNIADLTFLINFLFRGGPAPAVPDPGIRPNPGKAQVSLEW